jgi:hypothetical protein
MKQLAKTLGLEDRTKIDALQTELCRVTERYLVLLDENAWTSDKRPSGLTYRNRAAWLRKGLIEPANKILKSLDAENRPWLGTFPNVGHQNLPPYPAFPYIEAEISALRNWAQSLEKMLNDGDEFSAAKPLTDIKYALVDDLLKIYHNLPSRLGNAELRRPKVKSVELEGRQQKLGEFADFVRLSAEPILGRYDNLTDQMDVAIRKFNELRKE